MTRWGLVRFMREILLLYCARVHAVLQQPRGCAVGARDGLIYYKVGGAQPLICCSDVHSSHCTLPQNKRCNHFCEPSHHNINTQSQVAKVVAPKRAKLAEAEGTYESVMAGLRTKQGELQVGVSIACTLSVPHNIRSARSAG